FVGTGRHVPGAIRIAAALAFWYAFAGAGTVAILGGAEGVTTESALAFGDPASFAPTAAPLVEDDAGAQRAVVALVQVAVGAAILAFGGLRWPQPAIVRPRAGRGVVILGVLYLLAV